MEANASPGRSTAGDEQLTTLPSPWYRGFANAARSTRLRLEAPRNYHYRPLDIGRQEIRVLHRLPRKSGKHTRCRLEHVSLAVNPKPRYETVSYCWGDPTPCRIIIVEASSQLLVPLSTWLALKRLTYDHEERTLWIDAVCINQRDKTERGHQVALMREVYSHGLRNIVLLGEPVNEELMNEAFATIQALHIESRGDAAFQQMLTNMCSAYMGRSQSPIQTKWSEHSMHALFSNPLFSRLWVLQETCLASENLCVFGRLELDFRVIVQVAYWFRVYHSSHISLELFSLPGLASTSDALEVHVRYRRYQGLVLGNAFDIGRAFEATEPHDKVYGLLGLVPRHLRELETLRPNYLKSWQDVYADATREAVRNGNGEILRMISHRDEADILVHGLPSWVPRLQRRWDGSVHPTKFTYLYLGRPLEVPVCAGGLGQALRLEGWTICPVKCVSDVAPFEEPLNYRGKVQWFDHVAAMASSVAKKDNDMLARTLMADINWQRLRSTASDRLGYSTFVEYLANGSTIIEPSAQVVRLGQFWSAIQQNIMNRRFAVTQDRHLVLAPRVTQPSDRVVYIEGCLMPLVLRQKEDHFLLLGECYIDGLMRWQEDFDEFYEQLEQTPKTTFEIH